MARRSRGQEKRAHPSVEQALDLPEILHKDVPHIELQGNAELALDGCKGILEYTEESIRLHAGALLLYVSGSNLCIRMYSEAQTVITGNIRQVALERVTA